MKSEKPILVTSALIYANGAPHLGHVLETIQADIFVRAQKLLGKTCYYISGSDSHGTPIMIQAEKQGISPEAMTSAMREIQANLFSQFYVQFDHYHQTHTPENEKWVQDIFHRLKQNAHIAKRTIAQAFDPIKQMFLPDRYVKGECPRCQAQDQYGDNCEQCGATYSALELKNPRSVLSDATPISKESEHYFFELPQFSEYLKNYLKSGVITIELFNKLNEWFEAGLQAWDITRDAPYFGIPIPGSPNQYFYVWLDAPIGYIASFSDFCHKNPHIPFEDFWKSDSNAELYQFIGKDIVNFHALFWPAMLHGSQLRTPTQLCVHGFLTLNGQKMSKSRGTLISAQTYLNHLPAEYLRYYLAAKLSSHVEDIDLEWQDFTNRINSDLIGKYINIASRASSFLQKYFNNELSVSLSEEDTKRIEHWQSLGNKIPLQFQNREYSHAIRDIMAMADEINQYVDQHKPWHLIKDQDKQTTVQAIATVALNGFRLLSLYLKPILPETAKRVELFLNIPELHFSNANIILLNHQIQTFSPLLTRIDPKCIEALMTESQQAISAQANNQNQTTTQNKTEINSQKKDTTAEKKYVSIDTFNQLDLRVATIMQAEIVEGSDKLLKLMVDVGEGQLKQIFSGIRSAYQPENLIGKQIVIIHNLEPRKMRFGLSEGMALCAGDGSNLWLISPDKEAPNGATVK